MKRSVSIILAAAVFIIISVFTSFAADFSANWYQDADGWHIQDASGNMIRNAWVCDDVQDPEKNTWYLIDGNGSMVSSPLVQDGTGNYYSLETEHNGYFGMLRYQSGVYSGVRLELEGNHTGAFASLTNPEGVEALKEKYGLTSVSDISNENIVYTSSFVNTGGHSAETLSAGTGASQMQAVQSSSGSASPMYSKFPMKYNYFDFLEMSRESVGNIWKALEMMNISSNENILNPEERGMIQASNGQYVYPVVGYDVYEALTPAYPETYCTIDKPCIGTRYAEDYDDFGRLSSCLWAEVEPVDLDAFLADKGTGKYILKTWKYDLGNGIKTDYYKLTMDGQMISHLEVWPEVYGLRLHEYAENGQGICTDYHPSLGCYVRTRKVNDGAGMELNEMQRLACAERDGNVVTE